MYNAHRQRLYTGAFKKGGATTRMYRCAYLPVQMPLPPCTDALTSLYRCAYLPVHLPLPPCTDALTSLYRCPYLPVHLRASTRTRTQRVHIEETSKVRAQDLLGPPEDDERKKHDDVQDLVCRTSAGPVQDQHGRHL